MCSTNDNYKIFHNNHFMSTVVHYPFITKLARLATHKYLTATPKITFTFQSNVTTYRIL